jgi:hypothetical protein
VCTTVPSYQLRWHLVNTPHTPGVALSHDPPDFSLPSSKDYRLELGTQWNWWLLRQVISWHLSSSSIFQVSVPTWIAHWHLKLQMAHIPIYDSIRTRTVPQTCLSLACQWSQGPTVDLSDFLSTSYSYQFTPCLPSTTLVQAQAAMEAHLLDPVLSHSSLSTPIFLGRVSSKMQTDDVTILLKNSAQESRFCDDWMLRLF